MFDCPKPLTDPPCDPAVLLSDPEILADGTGQPRVLANFDQPVDMYIEYGPTAAYGSQTTGTNGNPITPHFQPIPGANYEPVYVRLHFTTADGCEAFADFVLDNPTFVDPGARIDTLTFSEIEAAGLDKAVYETPEEYAAEYLFQHPNACLFEIDEAAGIVCTIAPPAEPDDAIVLPAPSGGNDTNAVQAVINANPGGTFTGLNRVYRLGTLVLSQPVDIYRMPFIGVSTIGIFINGPDVHLFDCPGSGGGGGTMANCYRLDFTALRTWIIRGGSSAMNITNGQNCSACYIDGARDFIISCGDWRDLINDVPTAPAGQTQQTGRANVFILNGGNDHPMGGGWIFNNVANNFQSNGRLNDAEFVTMQSHTTPSLARTYIAANRSVNVGKRNSKHQSPTASTLSNIYEWRDRTGPLGTRQQLDFTDMQQDADETIIRNNRFIVGANSQGRWDSLVIISPLAGRRYDDIHVDGNLVTIMVDPPATFYARLLDMDAKSGSSSGTSSEVTGNSTFTCNVVDGPGSLNAIAVYDKEFSLANDGGFSDTSGNVINVPVNGVPYRDS